jgi:hypothetical protein
VDQDPGYHGRFFSFDPTADNVVQGTRRIVASLAMHAQEYQAQRSKSIYNFMDVPYLFFKRKGGRGKLNRLGVFLGLGVGGMLIKSY